MPSGTCPPTKNYVNAGGREKREGGKKEKKKEGEKRRKKGGEKEKKGEEKHVKNVTGKMNSLQLRATEPCRAKRDTCGVARRYCWPKKTRNFSKTFCSNFDLDPPGSKTSNRLSEGMHRVKV